MALHTRMKALRVALAEHWSLQDKLGGSYTCFAEAPRAAKMMKLENEDYDHIAATLVAGNWARHSPPPSAPPPVPPVPAAYIAAPMLEEFRSKMYANTDKPNYDYEAASFCSAVDEHDCNDEYNELFAAEAVHLTTAREASAGITEEKQCDEHFAAYAVDLATAREASAGITNEKDSEGEPTVKEGEGRTAAAAQTAVDEDFEVESVDSQLRRELGDDSSVSDDFSDMSYEYEYCELPAVLCRLRRRRQANRRNQRSHRSVTNRQSSRRQAHR